MTNFDIGLIKNSIRSAYNTVSAKAAEWMGRTISITKSGREVVLPYLQDQRIAAVSLVALSLILIEISELTQKVLQRFLPNQTDGQQQFGDIVCLFSGLGVLGGGVTAFSRSANLPLRWTVIAGITAATVYARANFCSFESEIPSDLDDPDDAIYIDD